MLNIELYERLNLPPITAISRMSPNDAYNLFRTALKYIDHLNSYSGIAFKRYWRSESGMLDEPIPVNKLASAIAKSGINLEDLIKSLSDKNK